MSGRGEIQRGGGISRPLSVHGKGSKKPIGNVEGRTFSGRRIDWWPEGKGLFSGKFFEGFMAWRNTFNAEHAQKVRDDFLAKMKEEVSQQKEANENPDTSELLESIISMPEEEMSEVRRMELVLMVGDKIKTKGARASEIVTTAEEYFEKQRSESFRTINQIIKIYDTGPISQTVLDYKEKLASIRGKYEKEKFQVRSEEELKKLQNDYAWELVKELTSLCEAAGEKVNKLEANVRLLTTERNIMLSEEEKKALVGSVRKTKDEGTIVNFKGTEMVAIDQEVIRTTPFESQTSASVALREDADIYIETISDLLKVEYLSSGEKKALEGELGKIRKEYEKREVYSQDALEKLKMDYAKAVIEKAVKIRKIYAEITKTDNKGTEITPDKARHRLLHELKGKIGILAQEVDFSEDEKNSLLKLVDATSKEDKRKAVQEKYEKVLAEADEKNREAEVKNKEVEKQEMIEQKEAMERKDIAVDNIYRILIDGVNISQDCQNALDESKRRAKNIKLMTLEELDEFKINYALEVSEIFLKNGVHLGIVDRKVKELLRKKDEI